MSWKLRVLVPAILAAPQAAFALGLGDIRLNSALNEPLSAEIDLVAAAPEEVDTLRAQLASRELFERYGLDRASYLDSLTFRIGKGRDGRSVLLVRSAAPIAEPFVTFLVEVNWPRGKLLREYTVLLDPPVYAPVEAARAPAIVAPRVVSQPAAAPAPSAAEPLPDGAPAIVSAPSPTYRAERPTSYRVQRNDTLYQIAETLGGGGRRETQRMMIALFRANPAAFSGNINRLQQGATLRVPAAEEVAAVGTGEAAQEVARQTAEWRGATATATAGAAVADAGHLKLVTPQEGAASVGAAAAAADAAAARRVRQLEQELADSRRLLDLKNAEMAALQRKLAGAAVPPPAATEAPPTPEGAATAPPPAEEVAAPATEPAAVPPKERKKKVAPKVEQAAPSLVDRLAANWIYVLGAAGVLLAGLLGFGFLRRRREDEFESSFEASGAAAPAYGAAPAMRGPDKQDSIVVEERAAAEPSAPDLGGRLDDTFSSESAVNIDHSDPLAEADFHMAYGLHDQAADLIKLALEKEPNRRDLKNKLLEVYFVWGNKDRFLEIARDLQSTRQQAAPGEWERIVIMGRQIAPDHALFAGTVSSAAMGAMDVNLEGGQTRVDIELLSPLPADSDSGVDLDLGQALGGGASDDTGGGEALDLDLGGPAPAGSATAELPTIEMPRPSERTAELPTVEMPTPDASTTAEQPQLDRSGETIRENFELPPMSAPGADATAELSVDDLGIDLGELESLTTTAATPVPGIDDTSTMLTQLTEVDDATRLAPHLVEGFGLRDSGVAVEHDAGRTEVLPQLTPVGDVSDVEPTQIALTGDIGSTEVTRVLETTAEKPALDFDLGDETISQPPDSAPTTKLGFGDPDQGQTARIDVTDMPQLVELEPVTLSEVGTKLDLARAYMDMGDPDGARSILHEVLAEGSASQKQEAQRLLDALPGVA